MERFSECFLERSSSRLFIGLAKTAREKSTGERVGSVGAWGKSKERNEFLSKKGRTAGRNRSQLLHRWLNEICEKLREKQYASSRSGFAALRR